MLQRMIDATGLNEQAVLAVETLVAQLRQDAKNPIGVRPSIFDAIGKVAIPRTAKDIEEQLADERRSWDEA